jgi:hypothetical protein
MLSVLAELQRELIVATPAMGSQRPGPVAETVGGARS